MNKDITNKNSKEQYHGYQEWYIGMMFFRCNFKNDKPIGYGECHRINKTYFYIR